MIIVMNKYHDITILLLINENNKRIMNHQLNYKSNGNSVENFCHVHDYYTINSCRFQLLLVNEDISKIITIITVPNVYMCITCLSGMPIHCSGMVKSLSTLLLT